MDYFQEYIKSDSKIDFIIPIYMQPDKFISITLSGIKLTYRVDDPNFKEVTDFFNVHLIKIGEQYSKSHVFTDPFLSFRPDSNECTMKIGMMSRSRYEKMCEKLDSKMEPKHQLQAAY